MQTFIERGHALQALQQQLNIELAQARLFFDKPAVTVRPVQADDIPLLYEMHQRLSPNTIFNRYLRPYRPSLAEMADIASLRDSEGMAFVATQVAPREAIVGVAYYIVDPNQLGTAEPAILVEDSFQGQGIGSRLFRCLSRHALSHDIHTFDAIIYPANVAVMRLLQRSGFPVEEKLAYGTREVRIRLRESKEPTSTPVCA